MKLKPGAWALIVALLAAPQKPCDGYLIPTIIFSTLDGKRRNIRISKTELQRIFTRKVTRWENGEDITVYIKPIGSIEHRNFVSDVLGMTLYRYKQNLEVNTYIASSVKVVNSDAEMQVAVYLHPGSIGYLNYSMVSDDNVVVLCPSDEYCRLK